MLKRRNGKTKQKGREKIVVYLNPSKRKKKHHVQRIFTSIGRKIDLRSERIKSKMINTDS